MKKLLTLVLAALALTAATVSPAHAWGYGYGNGYGGGYRGGYGGGYRGGYYNNSVNPWAAAAVGAVIGVGIGAAVANSYQAPPVYYAPPIIVQPPVVMPYAAPYVPPPRPCQLVQVPVVDQYGRVLSYQQVCAR